MPTPSHSEIIAGFFKSFEPNRNANPPSEPRRDIDRTKSITDASFFEMISCLHGSIMLAPHVPSAGIDLTQAGNNINDRLCAYLKGIGLTEQEWRALCFRDFGIEVLSETTTSAQIIYAATFLSIMILELINKFPEPFQTRQPTRKHEALFTQMADQILIYLKQYQHELWAKAHLACLYDAWPASDADSKENHRQFKEAVLSATPEQQKLVHPGILVKLQMYGIDGDLIPVEKMAALEETLDRCKGALMHFYAARKALDLVAANLSYACLKELSNPMFQLYNLVRLGPSRNIEKIGFSDEVLQRAIQREKQLLILEENIISLSFLIYMAYRYKNKQAYAALAPFFAQLQNPRLSTFEKDMELFDKDNALFIHLQRAYNAGVSSNPKALKTLNPEFHLAPSSYLPHLTTEDLPVNADEVKNRMFIILSEFFYDLSSSRCIWSSLFTHNKMHSRRDNRTGLPVGPEYIALTALSKNLAEFFADLAGLKNAAPQAKPAAKKFAFSNLFRQGSPELSSEASKKQRTIEAEAANAAANALILLENAAPHAKPPATNPALPHLISPDSPVHSNETRETSKKQRTITASASTIEAPAVEQSDISRNSLIR